MGAQIIAVAHDVWAIFSVLVSPGRSSPHSSHAGLDFVFPGSWHQGVPTDVWLSVHLSAAGQCQWTHRVWLLPLFLSYTLCRTLSSQPSVTQCSWWAWFQFLFQSQMNSQGHSFFGYSAIISKCHLWACTDMHSSLLFPVPGNLRCQRDQHSWASEFPGHSVSRWGFGQLTGCSNSSHGTPGKPTLWQHPKGPLFLMGFRPPWVPPLPM